MCARWSLLAFQILIIISSEKMPRKMLFGRVLLSLNSRPVGLLHACRGNGHLNTVSSLAPPQKHRRRAVRSARVLSTRIGLGQMQNSILLKILKRSCPPKAKDSFRMNLAVYGEEIGVNI